MFRLLSREPTIGQSNLTQSDLDRLLDLNSEYRTDYTYGQSKSYRSNGSPKYEHPRMSRLPMSSYKRKWAHEDAWNRGVLYYIRFCAQNFLNELLTNPKQSLWLALLGIFVLIGNVFRFPFTMFGQLKDRLFGRQRADSKDRRFAAFNSGEISAIHDSDIVAEQTADEIHLKKVGGRRLQSIAYFIAKLVRTVLFIITFGLYPSFYNGSTVRQGDVVTFENDDSDSMRSGEPRLLWRTARAQQENRQTDRNERHVRRRVTSSKFEYSENVEPAEAPKKLVPIRWSGTFLRIFNEMFLILLLPFVALVNCVRNCAQYVKRCVMTWKVASAEKNGTENEETLKNELSSKRKGRSSTYSYAIRYVLLMPLLPLLSVMKYLKNKANRFQPNNEVTYNLCRRPVAENTSPVTSEYLAKQTYSPTKFLSIINGIFVHSTHLIGTILYEALSSLVFPLKIIPLAVKMVKSYTNELILGPATAVLRYTCYFVAETVRWITNFVRHRRAILLFVALLTLLTLLVYFLLVPWIKGKQMANVFDTPFYPSFFLHKKAITGKLADIHQLFHYGNRAVYELSAEYGASVLEYALSLFNLILQRLNDVWILLLSCRTYFGSKAADKHNSYFESISLDAQPERELIEGRYNELTTSIESMKRLVNDKSMKSEDEYYQTETLERVAKIEKNFYQYIADLKGMEEIVMNQRFAELEERIVLKFEEMSSKLNQGFNAELEKLRSLNMKEQSTFSADLIDLSKNVINLQTVFNQFETGNVRINQSELTEDSINQMIANALKIYDSDKTGKVDYALESSGGSVISTRCTKAYKETSRLESLFGINLWYISYTPRTVIQHRANSLSAGECWAFRGVGYLFIKLSSPINVTEVSYEHLQPSLNPNSFAKSAPNNFQVWAYESADNIEQKHLLGDYHYDSHGDALQSFSVQTPRVERTQFVELVVLNNWGMNYTCLYRFRVHGHIMDATGVIS